MKNAKKGIAWMLVCVLLMGLFPMNVSSAVEGAADGITTEMLAEIHKEAEEVTEVAMETEVPDEGGETAAEVTTEAVVAKSTMETERESAAEAVTSTELTTEIASEAIVSTEDREKSTEVSVDAVDEVKIATVTEDKPVAVDAGIMLMDEQTSHELSVDSIIVEINGQKLSETAVTDVNVKNGDSIDIQLTWSISNDKLDANTGDIFEYDLNASGIQLPAITSADKAPIPDKAGKTVGYYYIENGKLYMVFTDAGFLTDNERNGSLKLNGKVNLTDEDLKENGTGVIKIAEKEFSVTVDDTVKPVGVTVTKSTEWVDVPQIDEKTGLPMRQYTITITATEKVGEISLEDMITGGNVLIDTTITVEGGTVNWENEGFRTEYKKREFYTGLQGKIASMNKGDVIKITYWAYGKDDLYSDSAWGDENTVTVTNEENGNKASASANFWVTKPSVNKDGEYNREAGTVEWKITVSNPDGIDLVGTKIKDTLQNKLTDYVLPPYDGMVTIKGFPDEDVEITLDEFLEKEYEFPENSTGKEYTFTYTIELSEAAKNSYASLKQVGNDVEISNGHYSFTGRASKTVGVGKGNPLTGKTDISLDGDTIEWASTIEVTEELSGVTYIDWFDTTMTLDADSVQVMKDDEPIDGSNFTVENDDTHSEFNGFKIIFNGSLEEGTYTITYKTVINPDATAKKFMNYAELEIGTVKTASVQDDVTLESMLEKRGDGGWGTDKQKWTLTIPAAALSKMSGGYTIKDTLPENCVYVKDSASANHEGLEVTVDEQAGEITFDISKVVENAKNAAWTYIEITYETRLTNMDEFLASSYNGVTYTNAAELYQDDTRVDRAEAKATSYPNNTIISKNVNYTEITAPEARYTINVNENGYDLLENGDTLTVTDTLPQDFQVIESSVTVTDGNSGDVLTGVSIEYNEEDNKLVVTVPDSQYVKIQYSVRINMPVGTLLTDENSTNTVSIEGYSGYSGEVSLSKVGIVLEGNASAGSESKGLTIKKYSGTQDNLINGAKFLIKMVRYTDGSFTDVSQEEVSSNYQVSKEFTIDEDGSFTVTNLLYDMIYEVSETDAPEGYNLDDAPRYYVFISQSDPESYPANVNVCQTSTTDYFENKPMENMVFFSKQEVGGTEELFGATITLYDVAGKEVTSWVSGTSTKKFQVGNETLRDENGNVTQLAAGTYTMRETGAPDGYAYAEDITFTIDADGKITTIGQNGEVVQDGTKLIMRDKAIGYIYISKKAIAGSDELPGAHIVLTERASGKVIAEWNSGSEAYKLAGTLFKAGTEYVLKETIAPNGYDRTEEIIFKIDRNGTLLLSADNTNKDAEVTTYNGASENNQIIMRDAVSATTEEETTEEKTTEEKTTEEKKTTNSKKTGDEMPIAGMALLYGMSVTGILVLQRKKRQKKQ